MQHGRHRTIAALMSTEFIECLQGGHAFMPIEKSLQNRKPLLDSMTRTLRTGRLCRFRRSGASRSRTMSFIAGKGARRHEGTGGPT